MKRSVFDKQGMECLREEEAEPVCGEDFCDSCGDCLACYWEDSCRGGEHFWVVYGED